MFHHIVNGCFCASNPQWIAKGVLIESIGCQFKFSNPEISKGNFWIIPSKFRSPEKKNKKKIQKFFKSINFSFKCLLFCPLFRKNFKLFHTKITSLPVPTQVDQVLLANIQNDDKRSQGIGCSSVYCTVGRILWNKK